MNLRWRLFIGRRLSLLVAAILVLVAAASGAGVAVEQDGGAAAFRAEATPPWGNATAPNCTVWRADASDPLGPEECSESRPWWTVWDTCPVTPVHGEPWQGEPGLERVPWVWAEPASAGVAAHLYFGSRPLHTNNRFPDGAAAKVLWTFDHGVSGMTLAATNLWNKGPTLSLGGDPNGTTSRDDWPSYIAIPTPGCWRVDVRAHDQHGPIVASVTFIVVDK